MVLVQRAYEFVNILAADLNGDLVCPTDLVGYPGLIPSRLDQSENL
jgi:hypothetical protein